MFARDELTEDGRNKELPSWIAQHAIAIRSIDPEDDDFSDLEFLIDVIGDARVVQLGEADHAGGNGFAAKARLVKFLHQRLGFDVLVWEECIYDMRLAKAELHGSEDVVAVMEHAIRPGWANALELRPLFDYVRSSLTTMRPLELAGYDTRFSPYALDHLAGYLPSLVDRLRNHEMRRQSRELLDAALTAHARIAAALGDGKELPADGDLEAFDHRVSLVLSDIDAHRNHFEHALGARETGFLERVVESLRTHAPGAVDLARAMSGGPDAGAAFGRFWHLRDAQGARNLRWLIDEEYRGHKVMFWAHNVHVMNAHAGEMFGEIRLEPREWDMTPAGVPIAEWFGDDVYTIGLVHYSGEVGPASDPVPIPDGSPGTLEALLHDVGEPYLFLDLRCADSLAEHPLHTELSLRVILPSTATLTDVTHAFDGILYVDRVTPTTLSVNLKQS